MKNFVLSVFLLFGILPALAKPVVDSPSVKEIMAWQKKSKTLDVVLLKNGWLKKNSFNHLNGSSIFENKKQSHPQVFLYKKIGMLKKPMDLKTYGTKECEAAKVQSPGAELKSHFDSESETYTCWVRTPAKLSFKKERSFYLHLRTVAKGSKHYRLQAAEVSIDESSPKPSATGRSIASELVIP